MNTLPFIRRSVLTIFLILPSVYLAYGQQALIKQRIDSLLNAKTAKPFNGIVLIENASNKLYEQIKGFGNLEQKTPLQVNSQFVIGSISKQITAVLLLQAYEQKRVDLTKPIRFYLPQLTQSWADSVTVHHLLVHTHGITALDKPLSFEPGTQYQYSQLGYELLAKIIEAITNRSFADVAASLFKQCGMVDSFHPAIKHYKYLVSGYSEQADGRVTLDQDSFQNYVAAGSFISTVNDLTRWNTLLHSGKLLRADTYAMMLRKYSQRDHPLFGVTDYGYGVTVMGQSSTKPERVGQTGFAPGFVSMSYYYPNAKISVVALSNVAYDPDELKNTFYYHLQVLRILQESKLIKR